VKGAELIGQTRRFPSRSIEGGPMPAQPTPVWRIKKTIAAAVVGFVLFSAMSLSAQVEQVFKGDMCLGPEGREPIMQGDQATLPCTVGHPKRSAKYILFNAEDKTTYQLEGHTNPSEFAGRAVVVVGTLNTATNTIYVEDIFRAVPPKILHSASVYIDCDACPRGMAAAWRAAFQELGDWGKFEIVPDPKKADLVFLFAANPYLGDYVTRDGPDKRPVAIETTYMNVIDPKTGESLWNDSRQMGSLFVAKATRAMISELKLRIEEENQADPQLLLQRHKAH
jgi:hypothetical protein